MSARGGSLLVLAAVVTASECGGSDARESTPREPASLSACVTAWNRPSNFGHGAPGAHLRRLEPRPAVPQFAHLSRRRDGRCMVFLDTPRGARTFQFRPEGSLPAL